nr:uncharacterized protein LOC105866432 [Microcebus murinus]
MWSKPEQLDSLRRWSSKPSISKIRVAVVETKQGDGGCPRGSEDEESTEKRKCKFNVGLRNSCLPGDLVSEQMKFISQGTKPSPSLPSGEFRDVPGTSCLHSRTVPRAQSHLQTMTFSPSPQGLGRAPALPREAARCGSTRWTPEAVPGHWVFDRSVQAQEEPRQISGCRLASRGHYPHGLRGAPAACGGRGGPRSGLGLGQNPTSKGGSSSTPPAGSPLPHAKET